MQNNTAVIAQKMMNRQAPYGPIGMVSQNMSGNKKGAAAGGVVPSGPVIGLKFDTATATSGVVFSNSDTTATASAIPGASSAKGSYAIIPNTSNNWYWEFTLSTNTNSLIGVCAPTFICNSANQVGFVANSVGYYVQTGQIYAAGSVQTTIATANVGDVIGFKFDVFSSSSALTILKNGVVILNAFNSTTWIPNFATAWTPIWSSAAASTPAATISNNIYSYAGYTPIGSSVTTIAASASVPAVADGAYDVYTFNASGTFTAGSTGAVRALVIAGGGAGGKSGGGGSGGYQEKGVVITPQAYAITIGGGGSFAARGSNSVFSSVTSLAGGGGNAPYSGGGSGEGGSPVLGFNNTVAGGAGTAGQGFAGGAGDYSVLLPSGGGGGGGGAGAAGSDGAGFSGQGGAGGAGLSSNITGVAVTRGGGGGGTGGVSFGAGGAGGGGTGGVSFGIGTAGTINTGGGSGGAGDNSAPGGSGVVIIRVRARA